MEKELNVTLTFDGHVEVHRYGHVYFMVGFIAYVLIVCSNSTIVYLIYKHQDLHEPMYVFIAALLLNSVLLSTNIYPKLLMDFLSERQVISYRACLVQYFMFYSLGNSEFLLLSAMAYDRYVSICKPLQYQSIMSRTSVGVFVASSWLLPAAHVVAASATLSGLRLCSIMVRGIFCNSSVYKLLCVASGVSVFVMILLNLVFLPVIFIMFTYTRIICYRSCREVRSKAARTCLPHLLVLVNLVFLVSYDAIAARLDSELPKNVCLTMTLQLVFYNPLLNPFVYGLKIREIYKHLRKLFLPDETK